MQPLAVILGKTILLTGALVYGAQHNHPYQAFLGFIIFLACAWLFSNNKRRISWTTVLDGFLLQMGCLILMLHVTAMRYGLQLCGQGLEAIKKATTDGTTFVFGYLAGTDVPFQVAAGKSTWIFFFQALPMIMVVSALAMLGFHWRLVPWIVRCFSYVFRHFMNLSGPTSLCAAAEVFFGQTDAPMLIRPYLARLSRSDLLAIMTMGMATTAATIMPLYSSLLSSHVAEPMTHILTASVINIPAAILFAKILIPSPSLPAVSEVNHPSAEALRADLSEKQPENQQNIPSDNPYVFANSMDAIARGTTDGWNIIIGVANMLIVVLALISLLNMIIGYGAQGWTLQRACGVVCAPIVWLTGIPWGECFAAGALLGTKTAVNEVAAMVDFSQQPKEVFTPLTSIMMTYILCSFGNISSLAIQIGGIGALVPERRTDIMELGWRALLASTLACLSSAALVGLMTASG